jgi:hypothetical protein
MHGASHHPPAFQLLFVRPSTRLPRVFAVLTGQGSVRLQASRARRASPGVELVRDVSARSEVHLIRRLVAEGGVGEAGVVLLDVERDELPERREAVERVEVEPLVLERSPPGLDHRVRERDLGHRKEASKDTRVDEVIDSHVEVLDAAVGEEGGRSVSRGLSFPAEN